MHAGTSIRTVVEFACGMTAMTGVVTRRSTAASSGVQGFYEHESGACGGPMRFSVYLPPAALRGERVPVALLPRRADLHRGDLRDQGGRAAGGGGARAGAGRLRHQPARDALPGRRRGLGLRPGRRLLRRRHRGAVVDGLPHVQLRDARAARGRSRRTSPSRRAARHLRPLDGRPRRAGAGAAQSRTLPQRLGVRAHRRAERGAVGRKGVRRLPRRRPRGAGARTTPARWCARRAASTARSSSIRARPTSS